MGVAPSFAVVVPFYNEDENCITVCRELRASLDDFQDAEVVLVDDGSTDETARLLDEIAREWEACRVFHLPVNQGQSAALLHGFEQTRAPIIVTMDGDGQNDPRDIPKLLARLREADMVVGIRSCRHDSWARRIISRIANRLRSRLLGDRMSDAGCALKAFRKEVVSAFIPIRTLYSFMPSLAAAAGFSLAEETVTHRPRAHGSSRYSLPSFLFFPIVDFIGLMWFNSRRCLRRVPVSSKAREEQFASRMLPALRRSLAIVSAAVVLVFVLLLSMGWHPHGVANVKPRRISLQRAESIALKNAPNGQLWTEELRERNGLLVWEIDVAVPRSQDVTEVDIDAVKGTLVAMRRESASEEQKELAAEDLRDEGIRGRPGP